MSLRAWLSGSTASPKRPASMADSARALSDSAVTAGVRPPVGLPCAGVGVGAGFGFARRGPVRCVARLSRGAAVRVRPGSMKTPALLDRSPSCARAAPVQQRAAASAAAKTGRRPAPARAFTWWLKKVFMALLY
ncbi:MAG: hypothetical protein LC795_19845 [Acidobacteria bacterium]|nr:hypothetical protein [Acidobacteriota bacterium]